LTRPIFLYQSKLEFLSVDSPIPLVSCGFPRTSSSCYDSAAIQYFLSAEDLRHAACEAIDVGTLERYARPMPVMLEYDQLLTTGDGQ
jgi:hypothetical protein